MIKQQRVDLAARPTAGGGEGVPRSAAPSSPSDRLNRAIIVLLQEDGRLPFKTIAEGLDPGPPLNKDLYNVTPEEFDERGIQRLPSNLLEPIGIFDKDDLAKEVLGPVMHNSYSL